MQLNLYKKAWSIYFVLVASFAMTYAQPISDMAKHEEKRRIHEANKVAEVRAITDFPQAGELKKALIYATTSQACDQAIDPYVEQNERKIIPFLKAHIELYSSCNTKIIVALIKLGEQEYYLKTLNDLKSEEVMNRVVAIERLSLIKSKESYRKLYELLDDTSGGKSGSDYIVRQMNYYVMDQLLRTVENPPIGPTRYDPAVWKAWFGENKHLIE